MDCHVKKFSKPVYILFFRKLFSISLYLLELLLELIFFILSAFLSIEKFIDCGPPQLKQKILIEDQIFFFFQFT